MKLKQFYLTENNCYKAGQKQIVKGIMVHSTGANNPNLNRYLAPDDGALGPNIYNNHWNQAKPGGREVCVHAFIGRLKDGTIGTYQTLPWENVGWHAGSGNKGSANRLGYIGFEICEDDLTDKNYFEAVYLEAVELCVYLCRLFQLPAESILCHAEGHQLGIADNHADVLHWWPNHCKSMVDFRQEVREGLNKIVYNRVEEIPVWARPTIQKMIATGVLEGTGKGLALTDEMLRTFVILARMLEKRIFE